MKLDSEAQRATILSIVKAAEFRGNYDAITAIKQTLDDLIVAVSVAEIEGVEATEMPPDVSPDLEARP